MSNPPISANETSGFYVTCIIWIVASESGGIISTTELECLFKAIDEDGLSSYLSNVDKTLTNKYEPELVDIRAWMSSTI